MKKILYFICLCFSFFGFSQQQKPLFIAHRGGILANFPENSLIAFKNCIDTNVAMIETDIRITKDGKMVLFHDASLLRMTGVSGELLNYTLTELQELNIGEKQKIPTLEQALAIIENSDIKLLLDIKAEIDYNKLFKFLKKYNMENRVYIGVRSLKDLKTCKNINGQVKVLGFIPGLNSIDDFINNNVNAIRLWPKWLKNNKSIISDLVQKEIPIWMTVKKMSNTEVKTLVKLGISGFIHDSPKKAKVNFFK